MATDFGQKFCEMTFIQHTGISKRIRISQFGFKGLLGTQVIEGDTMAPSGLYARLCHAFLVYCIFSARCNIFISRLCYDVSVRLSVRLSVTEVHVHWRIIANLGFEFRSHFTAHCGRHVAGERRAARRAACGRIISRHASQCSLA